MRARNTEDVEDIAAKVRPPLKAPEPPALNLADEHLLYTGPHRPCSHTDQMPPVPRPGSQDADRFPSRRGRRLYYADGRVTDLLGIPIP